MSDQQQHIMIPVIKPSARDVVVTFDIAIELDLVTDSDVSFVITCFPSFNVSSMRGLTRLKLEKTS